MVLGITSVRGNGEYMRMTFLILGAWVALTHWQEAGSLAAVISDVARLERVPDDPR